LHDFTSKHENQIWRRKIWYLPSLRIAIISTMNGGKSNCHMRASNMKPSCKIKIPKSTRKKYEVSFKNNDSYSCEEY
jgi:hypothetical protein